MADPNAEPFRGCPRFEICSVNNCPLHTAYPNLPVVEADPEKSCGVRRTSRLRVAALHPGVLPLGGLTEREHQRKVRRESRTPEEVERDRLRMKGLRGPVPPAEPLGCVALPGGWALRPVGAPRMGPFAPRGSTDPTGDALGLKPLDLAMGIAAGGHSRRRRQTASPTCSDVLGLRRGREGPTGTQRGAA